LSVAYLSGPGTLIAFGPAPGKPGFEPTVQALRDTPQADDKLNGFLA
jgi:hypothetical protein